MHCNLKCRHVVFEIRKRTDIEAVRSVAKFSDRALLQRPAAAAAAGSGGGDVMTTTRDVIAAHGDCVTPTPDDAKLIRAAAPRSD